MSRETGKCRLARVWSYPDVKGPGLRWAHSCRCGKHGAEFNTRGEALNAMHESCTQTLDNDG